MRTNEVTRPDAPPDGSNAVAGTSNLIGNDSVVTNRTESGGGPRERPPGRPRFGRPPWMSEKDYKELVEKRGCTAWPSSCPRRRFYRPARRTRGCAGLSAVLPASPSSAGFARGNLVKSSELQVRLVRASELNTHLKADESGGGRVGSRNAQPAEHHPRTGANDLQANRRATGSAWALAGDSR